MESTDSNINPCDNCTKEFNCFRSSTSKCSQCNYFLCSECILIHRQKHEQNIAQIRDQYNELLNEKEKYINDTSNESIEIVVNWYQRLINDLIESQTQIIENIQNERDRAKDELAKFDKNIQQINENSDINLIQTKLSNYQITKDIYLPNSHTYQPRYKVLYQFKDPSLIEEDWDSNTNETTNIPLPSLLSLSSPHKTTTESSLFFTDNSQTFVTPKDDEEENDFQWYEEIEETNENNCEYLLDPKLYHLGTSRRFNSDIHLIASNGNDILCYSRQTKQLIYIGDGNVNPLILQWYHGHMLQIIWFDNLKSFVILTDENQYEIYTIESTYNFRLKIRLRTCLTKSTDDIIKEKIFLRADEYHLFIYYERNNGQKRLRLLNPVFECIQSYSIDKCFQRDEHIHSHDNGIVIGLGVNQEYVVLFIRSIIDNNLLDETTSEIGDTRLLVFNKSKMCFIRRIILSNKIFSLPFIFHFINLSSFILVDQIHHILRFYNYEKEIGQINLLPSNTSPIFNSTTISKSNIDYQYSSIVLMNDGSLLLSNNTKYLVQLILNDQSNDLDDW